jgi:hypothetical protein
MRDFLKWNSKNDVNGGNDSRIIGFSHDHHPFWVKILAKISDVESRYNSGTKIKSALEGMNE